MRDDYDLVVIGSGPAGEKGAAHAAYFGKRVALVERTTELGGTPVSSAGIPTKTLREAALYVTGFGRRHLYGVGAQIDLDVALQVLHRRTQAVTAMMQANVRANLERHGIDVIHGIARLERGRQVVVTLANGRTRTLKARAILIATGSRPFHPTTVPFDDPDVHDSDTILDIDRPFHSIVVVGAGPIGCEYASIFNALGIEVTLLDIGPRLLPFLDQEISGVVADCFQGAGMKVRLGAGSATIARRRGVLTVSTEAGGKPLRTDKVLFAAGRSGNTENLGLQQVGVNLDRLGRVLVNAQFRTSVPAIYAAGDVIGPPALASVSMDQGRHAASNAMRTPYRNIGSSAAPFGVYSMPEVAMIGATEEAAGKSVVVGRAGFAGNARANIAGATDGIVKLIFNRADRRLLGAHIVGDIAAEMIHVAQAVLHSGGMIDYFIHSTFNVPTWTDAYKYAAFDALADFERRPSKRSARN
jgi:NAD(P) transhydrogenase